MKVKTAEQYLARYRRIGAKRAPMTRHADIGPAAELVVDDVAGLGQYAIHLPHLSVREKQKLTGRIYDHAQGSKPNHASRAVALPLKPLGPKPSPQQPVHPATEPMTSTDRLCAYRAFNGTEHLTHRQFRRWKHKNNRAFGRRAS